MKRFIQYLYEYQNGKKIRNAGFVKVEELEDEARLQIYGRGFPVAENRTLEIFLFYLEDGKCSGIPMGEIQESQAAFGYQLTYNQEDAGGEEIFHLINGIILNLTDKNGQKKFAAVWDDSDVDIERMIVQKVKIQEPEKEPEIKGPEKEEESEIQEEEPVEKEEKTEEKDCIYKITRQELAGLPRQEWKLANNHFLLHGYYNYHHLVSFEKEGKCWLGVPGIYLPGEQRAAGAFGFHQFMKPSADEVDLEEYEIEDKERFGYWCRPVSAVVGKKEKEHAAETDRRREIHEGGNQTGEEGVED